MQSTRSCSDFKKMVEYQCSSPLGVRQGDIFSSLETGASSSGLLCCVLMFVDII